MGGPCPLRQHPMGSNRPIISSKGGITLLLYVSFISLNKENFQTKTET